MEGMFLAEAVVVLRRLPAAAALPAMFALPAAAVGGIVAGVESAALAPHFFCRTALEGRTGASFAAQAAPALQVPAAWAGLLEAARIAGLAPVVRLPAARFSARPVPAGRVCNARTSSALFSRMPN